MFFLPVVGILSIGSQFVLGQGGDADTNGTCTTECAMSLNATISCETAIDPFCGCSDFLAGAPSCRTCLISTNTTLIGFFNSSYVNFIIGVCNCQRPSCGNLTDVEKECAVTDPNNQTCRCPATVVDGPDCYGCLKGFINDTFVLNGLDQTLAFCEQAVNGSSGNSSASASASASASQTAHSSVPASASASQSSIPSGTSGAESITLNVFDMFWKMRCVQFILVMVFMM